MTRVEITRLQKPRLEREREREQVMGVVRIEDGGTLMKRRIPWEKDDERFESCVRSFWKGATGSKGIPSKGMNGEVAEDALQRMPVCVTSGVSYIGRRIADRLTRRGYNVRLIVEAEDDLAILEETEALELSKIFPVVANLTEISSLCEAFDGCAGVFHTSAFLDPSGLSGYTKHMAEKEAAVARKVVEASALTPSVRRLVFTSSLLACIWRQHSSLRDFSTPILVDESWWSDETLCTEKKLWLALGKTMAEKAVWDAARGTDVKVATICPALATGPGFCERNTTASIAYLKGGREMYAEGLLATVDVEGIAEAHVSVYEAMRRSAAGRYVCFDQVVGSDLQAAEVRRQAGLAAAGDFSGGGGSGDGRRFTLSNEKLRRVLPSKVY